MKMLRDLVILKRDPLQTQSIGGVSLPDTQIEQPSTGVVTGVGPQVSDVVVGDHVRLSSYAGTEHIIDGEVYLITREQDVLAILRRASN